jgi:hypothetical protein
LITVKKHDTKVQPKNSNLITLRYIIPELIIYANFQFLYLSLVLPIIIYCADNTSNSPRYNFLV